jgi:CAAX prenyl protease-like protein
VSPRTLRRLAVLDVVAIPLLIALYIWRLQFSAPRFWMVFLVWLTASFLLHRDTPKTLGWRADNLWPATRQAAVVFAIFAAALLVAGLALGAPHRIPGHLASLRGLWNYFAFCLLQQVALQSFLNNRLIAIFSTRWLSSLLAGTIFGLLHWPNPVLVPATFVAGSAMAWLFARHRNIIPLAVIQAVLGALVGWAFPVAWHHVLRVGPGYYLLR